MLDEQKKNDHGKNQKTNTECYECGNIGHYSNACYSKKEGESTCKSRRQEFQNQDEFGSRRGYEYKWASESGDMAQ